MIPDHDIDGVPTEYECIEDNADENTDDEGWSDGDCVEEWLEEEDYSEDE